jgi:nitric oxide reductase activation protein
VSKILILVTGIVLLLSGTFRAAPAALAAAQQSGQRTESDPTREMQERMAREANTKRQQDIRDDTEKLFQLASELKAAVDKTNEHVLSLDVVRKADEVEKLAKKVKDKMKESISLPPRVEPLPRNLPNPLSRP